MSLTIFAGSANPALAGAVAAGLGLQVGTRDLFRFPDGELHVELRESVRGDDVCLIQPTGPPVDEHLMELLFLADACRRAGAAHLTAVISYFGYARQDRRASGREPVGARLVADLIRTGGLDRVVAVDVHTPAIEGFFSIPLEHLSAVPILAEEARRWVTNDTVIVAPDLGATKLAERYARLVDRPVAIVHKTRLSGEAVSVRRITGGVAGLRPLIVDDMISTGGTIEAAIKALLAADCLPEVTVVASHALLVGGAVERLRGLPVQRLVTTDSVPPPADPSLPLQVVGLGPLLAEAIGRLHASRSLSDLIVHG